jgi:hypothetical protein
MLIRNIRVTIEIIKRKYIYVKLPHNNRTNVYTVPMFYPAISGDLILASRRGESVVHFQAIM